MKNQWTIRWICFCVLQLCLYSCNSTLYTLSDYQKLDSIKIGNGLTFHPNKKQVLISKPSGEVNHNGKPFYRIFQCDMKNEESDCEEQVSFSSKFNDYHPVFSPDGKWLYFNSDRPVPNTIEQSEKINIWRVAYNNGLWGEPVYLSVINTENHESYPTIAKNGTLYFNSDRPGGMGSMDIYKSELVDGKFTEPKPITALNSADSENDLFIDPKERFIIINRYLFDSKEIELFIAYNKKGKWSQPQPLNTINKKGIWELTPTLSPDGKYLFYENEGRIQSFNFK